MHASKKMQKITPAQNREFPPSLTHYRQNLFALADWKHCAQTSQAVRSGFTR
jgi:hypothetical protein